MIKPKALKPGDTVAAISLSYGAAGEFPHRYIIGRKQLEETFGLNVIECQHSLKPAYWLKENPQARADDLMNAFLNPDVKAIISNVGGDDSIRLLPYLDLDVIKNNPKIFVGFSDTTVSHLVCYKAGLVSFYGPSLMQDFAENRGIFPYTVQNVQDNFFSNDPIGKINANTDGWTSERLEWKIKKNQNIRRKLIPCEPWNFMQGEGVVEGHLLGGCLEVLNWMKDTLFFPTLKEWNKSIMFLETSELKPQPKYLEECLRDFGLKGIFGKINGLIFGRPYDNEYAEAYEKVIHEVVHNEFNRKDLPIVTRMDFGHTAPRFTIPYGVNAQIDCKGKHFSLLESAVV